MAAPRTAAQPPDAPEPERDATRRDATRRDTFRREPARREAGAPAHVPGPADQWLARLRPPADQDAELAAEAESLAALGWPQVGAGDEPAAGDKPAAGAGGGPPDGDLAWLACLPGALIAEYADAAAAVVPPPREVLKAGFWDRSGEAGLGFASGGNADTLPPGPVLAGLAGRAWAGGLGGLTDDELIGVLRAGRRLASWSAALELAAAGEVMGRRYAEAEATGDARDAEHVGDEVAAALTLTARSADRLTDLAGALWRLPGTAAALAAGRIDLPRAELIAAECTGLSAEHAAAVEAEVLAAAPALTTGQLRPVVRRAVIAADPAAALTRKEQARKDARVERWAEHAGTAALAGRDLPPAAVLAADRHLSALAAQLKAAGLTGTTDNLRASAYLCLLAGQPVTTLLPGPAAADPAGDPQAPGGTGGDPRRGPALTGSVSSDNRGGPGLGGSWQGSALTAGPAPTGSASSGVPALAGSGSPGGPALTGSLSRGVLALAGNVNLTMPLATWLGFSEAPGEAAGYGALDAADARSLAAALAARPGNRWCITLTDAAGRPAAHG
ncbi:MAG: DUF222 domain-containing protein, partial [Actinobacteria bacterium]|nr:DUF222 domain-containing protein [Actinomycetota bacterium]